MSSTATAPPVADEAPAVLSRRPRRRPAPPLFALVILGTFVLAGILAPLLAPYDAENPSLATRTHTRMPVSPGSR